MPVRFDASTSLTTRSLAFVALLLVVGPAQGQAKAPPMVIDETTCGSLGATGYGPLDYRTAAPDQKALVEGAHFTKDVENLKGYYNEARGRRGAPGDDLDYTLRAFPNHPRALFAMVRLQEKEGTIKPKGARWPVPCYFERAIRFRPDDGNVRLVFGLYLMKQGNKEGAVREFEFAKNALGDDPNASYNLGLAYFEVGKYDLALAEAKRAKELGFPLEGLEKKLRRAGKWTE